MTTGKLTNKRDMRLMTSLDLVTTDQVSVFSNLSTM